MTTRTQIIEGLQAWRKELDAIHELLRPLHDTEISVSRKEEEARHARVTGLLDAAIALLEKLEAEQAEPVAYPSREQLNQWRSEWLDTVGGEVDEYVTRKSIEWYRSQRPAPTQQAEAVAADVHRLVAGAAYDLMGYLTSRKESITLSGSELATPAVDALAKWAETVGLSLRDPDIEHWRDKLHPAPKPADKEQ